MRQDLDHKLVPVVQQLLRLVREANTSGRAGDDDSTLGQRRALRKEADNLLDREDEIPKCPPQSAIVNFEKRQKVTHVNPLSCTTFPFFNPRIFNALTSPMTSLATSTGPMGHAPSKPLE